MREAEYDKHMNRLAALMTLYGSKAKNGPEDCKLMSKQLYETLEVAFRLLRKERIAKYINNQIDKYEQ